MVWSKVFEEWEAEVSCAIDTSEKNDEEVIYDTFKIDSLFLFGEEWDETKLRLRFGDQGAEEIRRLIYHRVEFWNDESYIYD
jgi:hypothetical protein